MIISCPECTGPFELADDHIAALVQIECPHCQFRMILDFAAANDPSLREDGMQMASGYRTAGEYWRSIPAERRAARPAVPAEPSVPVPEVADLPAPVEPAPRLAPESATRAPARVTPSTSPAVASPPTRPRIAPRPDTSPDPEHEAPVRRPRRDTVVGPLNKRGSPLSPAEPTVDLDYDDEPPTMVRSAADIEAEFASTARAGTGAASSRPRAPEFTPPTSPPLPERPDFGVRPAAPPPERPAPVTQVMPTVSRPAPAHSATVPAPSVPAPSHAPPGLGATRPSPSGPAPMVPMRPAVELPRVDRIPPHTPAPVPASTLAPESEPTSLPVRAGDSDAALERPRGRTSVIGVTLLVLLLLLALGLAGASFAMHGTPDPRPLLEDLLRQP